MDSEVFKEIINKFFFLKNLCEAISRIEIFWGVCLPVNQLIASQLQIQPFFHLLCDKD